MKTSYSVISIFISVRLIAHEFDIGAGDLETLLSAR